MAQRKSARAQRTVHYPGKPDLANYGQGPARWRLIERIGTDETLTIFGYESHRDYIGIPPADMGRAPCSHCGQLAFQRFTGTTAEILVSKHEIIHTCPGFLGRDSLGVEVPCPEGHEHVCTGKPSMSWHGVSRYPRTEWKEKV